MGVHVGTHVDAPRHLLDDGPPIAAMPLDIFVGPAFVIDVRGRAAIHTRDLAPALAMAADAPRVLLRTGAWEDAECFPTAFATVTAEAAATLIERGVRLLGTDAPSVDPFDSTDLPAHRALLSAGVPILENLDLTAVVEGLYELIALPLKLSDSDASPVRAILRRP